MPKLLLYIAIAIVVVVCHLVAMTLGLAFINYFLTPDLASMPIC